MGPGDRKQSWSAQASRWAARQAMGAPSRSTSAFLITGLSLLGKGAEQQVAISGGAAGSALMPLPASIAS